MPTNLFTDTIGANKAVIWSPDGTALLTVTHDGAVCVWNAHGGELLYELELLQEWYRNHQTGFRCAAWSPNGRYIAVGVKIGQVFLWDCENRQIVQVIRSHCASVSALSWSPDGDRLASASYDGMVKIWKVGEDLPPVLTYFEHHQPVYDVAWSPNGTYLASAGYDGTVQVWRSNSGRRVQTYRGHYRPVRALSWSPDSKLVASTGEDNSLQIWHAAVDKGAWLRTLGGVNTTRIAWLNGRLSMNLCQRVEWSRDGLLLALQSIAGIQLFCTKTHTYIDSYAEKHIKSFSLSPNGASIAVAGATKVFFWQLPHL